MSELELTPFRRGDKAQAERDEVNLFVRGQLVPSFLAVQHATLQRATCGPHQSFCLVEWESLLLAYLLELDMSGRWLTLKDFSALSIQLSQFIIRVQVDDGEVICNLASA